MTWRVADKVIVVTGGAKGIGRGCAEMLASEGARVVIGDIDPEGGANVVRSIHESGGEASFKHTDVRNETECADLIAHAVQTFGQLNGLVSNAGWFPRGTLEDTTAELWDDVIAVNLRSAFFCCKHAVPHIRAAGGGSIVTMGSTSSIQGLPNLVAYAAAKGGLLNLTKTLAGAYAQDRIRVNHVIPGWILTETEIALQTSRGLSADELSKAGEALPLGRHQTVEDVAYAVLFLCSNESSQITASTINVDAGVTAMPVFQGDSPYVG